ncbi:DUF4136 domain-containing protein [Pseudomonas cavernae]|uniref:DUF4136 domain-containing protein n=1 Tax=Pseudomonas cavernae TaxID=2320867 RepID=A0A385Z122_9PSED|nr:DUF4136 domain-containing protein [Pseudomonas cavernae]AYC31322.1 DUF4136 domain-containing protein [Pseudomonas cavernae]
MRVFALLLLCLALATCASHIPQIRIEHAAAPELRGRQSFQLMPPEQALNSATPYEERYAQLEPLLRQGLGERGYHESQTPQLYVYYWLALRDTPLEFRVDVPPPNPLGSYQAIHRLRDETGTLRLRLTDPSGQILWEGLVSTGLSPARDSAELLQVAINALLQQIPPAH